MKFLISVVRVASFAACLTVPGISAAIEVQCPARITMEPIVVRDVPEGWRTSQPTSSLPVWGVRVTVGPPEELGVLKPEIYTVQGHTTFNWTFIPAENERGIWLSCSYGNAPVRLAQKLPKGLSTCTSYEKDIKKDGGKVVTICH